MSCPVDEPPAVDLSVDDFSVDDVTSTKVKFRASNDVLLRYVMKCILSFVAVPTTHVVLAVQFLVTSHKLLVQLAPIYSYRFYTL